MNNERIHELRSQAIGQRIISLGYDTESGYVVIELESGDDLWIAACYEEGITSSRLLSRARANACLPRSPVASWRSRDRAPGRARSLPRR